MPPAQQMNVQVAYALTAIFSGVDHGSVPGGGDSLLPRERDRKHRKLAGYFRIGEVIQRSHVLFRDDENVHRGLGCEVAKGEAVPGAGDYVSRDLAVNDPAENALLIHCSVD